MLSTFCISFFLLSIFATVTSIPLIIRFAESTGCLSKIDFRRKQSRGTALLGGLPLAVMVLGYRAFTSTTSFSPFVLAGATLVIVGIFDDYKELSARPKFLVQILAVTCWLVFTPDSALLLSKVGVPSIAAKILTGFWVLGLINAMNMLDGLDGLATGIALIASITIASFTTGPLQMSMMILAGGCIGFLFFNWNPAKIYLGDTGSQFLGFTLATTAAQVSLGSSGAASAHLILLPLFLFALPEIDAMLAIGRRLLAKSPLSQGDHDHVHHKLRRLGLSVKQTVLVCHGVTFYAALSAITVSHLDGALEIALVSGLTATGLSAILFAVYFCENKLATQKAHAGSPYMRAELRIQTLSAAPTLPHATVYDLMPYYKSIPNSSFETLKDFVQDFASYAKIQHGDAYFCQELDHRLIVLEDKAADQNACASAFYEVLRRHGLQKNSSRRPWGLSFHDGQTNGEEFSRLFRASHKTATIVENQIAS